MEWVDWYSYNQKISDDEEGIEGMQEDVVEPVLNIVQQIMLHNNRMN